MIPDYQPRHTPEINVVEKALFQQLMKVMGISNSSWISRWLRPVFNSPNVFMSRLLVELDRNIAEIGWYAASKVFMSSLITDARVVKAEEIPLEGALMVVGNHPAAYDIAILAAAIPRNDVKILHSDIPILQMLPNVSAHGIPVPYDIPSRLGTVRNTIQHLRNGGAIVIFPRGNVEPDPSVSPGAEASLDGWSASIEMFLRRVPETKTVVAISSGMLSAKWFNNPIIKRWKKYEQRQKVAEIFQIMSQLFTRRKPSTSPMVNFSPAMSVDELGGVDAPDGMLLSNITGLAKQLLAEHPHV